MGKNRFYLFPWLVFLVFILTGCSQNDQTTSLVGQEIQNRLLSCGDSLYAPGGINFGSDGIVEMKDLTIKSEIKELSDADKANGIEWKGTVIVEAKTYREYSKRNGWEEWKSGTLEGNTNFRKQTVPIFTTSMSILAGNPGLFWVEKKNGKLELPKNLSSAQKISFNCDNLPK